MPLPKDNGFRGELARLAEAAGPRLDVGYSGDWGAADALLSGAACWYSVAGGLFPHAALRLTRAARAGDEEETRRLDRTFAPLWTLFRTHGSIRVVYAAARLMGLTQAVPPRPILPLPDLPDIEAAIADILNLKD
jgi:4-hydroxy-tetrahydrodipicolinate synthase